MGHGAEPADSEADGESYHQRVMVEQIGQPLVPVRIRSGPSHKGGREAGGHK